MMNLRIAMLLNNPFRPDIRVLREAEALVDFGHTVKIYAWDRDLEVERPARETLNNIEIVRIPVKSKRQLGLRQVPYYLMYAWYTFRMVMREEFDVVHCHDLPTLPLGVFLKLLRRVHLVYDAHEIFWIMESRKFPKWILWFIKYSENILLHWVDAFITVGQLRAEYYQQYYKQTIHVVGNWYDREVADQQLGKDLRRRLGIPEDAFVVAFAGRLSPERASNVLIDCAKCSMEGTQIHWLICGQGPAAPKIEQAASQSSNLHFLGWVEDTRQVYSAANALIYLMDLSYLYTQCNTPNSLYLSIAWKLPLIAVAAGEIRTVLTSEETGLLIERVDADAVSSTVRRLSKQSDLYARIVENLEKLQDTYSWEFAAKSLVSAYRGLIK